MEDQEKAEAETEEIQISIQKTNGDTFNVAISSASAISELKEMKDNSILSQLGIENGSTLYLVSITSQGTTPRQVYAPKSYLATFLAMQAIVVAGFVPAVVVYARKSRWWLNPILQPDAWAHSNTSAMSFHVLMTSAWIGITVLQIGVTSIPNYIGLNSKVGGIKVRSVHRAAGYIGLAVCLGMNTSAMHLVLQNGVSGKIVNNGIAIIIGSMMAYHILKGIAAVHKRDVDAHVWHMTSLFTWTCAPGFLRSLGILPLQKWLFGSSKSSLDVTYTSGFVMFPVLALGVGNYLLQYFILGERSKAQLTGFAIYGILFMSDIVLGLLDSLLKRPERPLLAQVPGQPFVLEQS